MGTSGIGNSPLQPQAGAIGDESIGQPAAPVDGSSPAPGTNAGGVDGGVPPGTQPPVEGGDPTAPGPDAGTTTKPGSSSTGTGTIDVGVLLDSLNTGTPAAPAPAAPVVPAAPTDTGNPRMDQMNEWFNQATGALANNDVPAYNEAVNNLTQDPAAATPDVFVADTTEREQEKARRRDEGKGAQRELAQQDFQQEGRALTSNERRTRAQLLSQLEQQYKAKQAQAKTSAEKRFLTQTQRMDTQRLVTSTRVADDAVLQQDGQVEGQDTQRALADMEGRAGSRGRPSTNARPKGKPDVHGMSDEERQEIEALYGDEVYDGGSERQLSEREKGEMRMLRRARESARMSEGRDVDGADKPGVGDPPADAPPAGTKPKEEGDAAVADGKDAAAPGADGKPKPGASGKPATPGGKPAVDPNAPLIPATPAEHAQAMAAAVAYAAARQPASLVGNPEVVARGPGEDGEMSIADLTDPDSDLTLQEQRDGWSSAFARLGGSASGRSARAFTQGRGPVREGFERQAEDELAAAGRGAAGSTGGATVNGRSGARTVAGTGGANLSTGNTGSGNAAGSTRPRGTLSRGGDFSFRPADVNDPENPNRVDEAAAVANMENAQEGMRHIFGGGGAHAPMNPGNRSVFDIVRSLFEPNNRLAFEVRTRGNLDTRA